MNSGRSRAIWLKINSVVLTWAKYKLNNLQWKKVEDCGWSSLILIPKKPSEFNCKMSPVKAFSGPCGVSLLLLLLASCCSVLQASSLSKPADHHDHHNGCETIQRILNGTATAGNHHSHHHNSDKDEGFLVDHEQWHNHKDCEYLKLNIMRRFEL